MKKKNKLPPFVPITWQILNSKAYKDLTPTAAKLLPYFIGKVQGMAYKDPRRHRTDFEFTYTEAERYGVSRSTFRDVLIRLMDMGFIDFSYRGGRRAFGLSASKFRLSERWQAYGTPQFANNTWRAYANDQQPRKTSKAA